MEPTKTTKPRKAAAADAPAATSAPAVVTTPAVPAAADLAAVPTKKKNTRLLVIFAIVVLLGAGLIVYLMLNPVLSTDNAAVDRTKATVSTKIMGLIARINTDEGQLVSKGAVLVELDPTELVAQKDQAQANLALNQDSIRQAGVKLAQYSEDYNRAKSQYAQKIISTEAYDHAEKAFQGAQIDYSVAQRRTDAAQAQLDLANANLADASIIAPFDAVVAKKWMNERDVMQPGQPVLTMYDSKTATVIANFEETKIAKFKIGQPADIHLDAYPGVVLRGHVIEIGTSTGNQFSLIPVNNAAGNFTKVTQRIPVKIAFDESTDLKDPNALRVLAGMSAEVDIRP